MRRKVRVWRASDPLYRGDSGGAISVPEPKAKTSIVAHILFIGGRGRETPFTSATESEDVAEHFGGGSNGVWQTDRAAAIAQGAAHIPRTQLLANLRGFGRGRAKWHDAWEIAMAATYVEMWSEHLLDWKAVTVDTQARVRACFRKRSA